MSIITLEHLKLLSSLQYLIITTRLITLLGGSLSGNKINIKNFYDEETLIYDGKYKPKLKYKFYQHTGYNYVDNLYRDTNIYELKDYNKISYNSNINYLYIEVLEDWKYVGKEKA